MPVAESVVEEYGVSVGFEWDRVHADAFLRRGGTPEIRARTRARPDTIEVVLPTHATLVATLLNIAVPSPLLLMALCLPRQHQFCCDALTSIEL